MVTEMDGLGKEVREIRVRVRPRSRTRPAASACRHRRQQQGRMSCRQTRLRQAGLRADHGAGPALLPSKATAARGGGGTVRARLPLSRLAVTNDSGREGQRKCLGKCPTRPGLGRLWGASPSRRVLGWPDADCRTRADTAGIEYENPCHDRMCADANFSPAWGSHPSLICDSDAPGAGHERPGPGCAQILESAA